MANDYTWGTGRRKTAIARVRVRPGTGTVLVNGRELDNYFPDQQWCDSALRPLEILEKKGQFDILASCSGGGPTGQAEAVSLGLARALVKIDEEAHMPELRKAGLLTRDARMVERKKYGLAGARRAYQFSKR